MTHRRQCVIFLLRVRYMQCRPEKVASLKNMMSTHHGSQANLHYLGIDLNSLKDFPDALDSCKIGPLDILISNAGSMHSGYPKS
jgi:hypothetical protein